MITRIDIPSRQVMIEARIVEADDTFGRALGVKLGASDLRLGNGQIPGWNIGGDHYGTVGGNYDAVGYQTGQVSGTVPYTDTQFVNLPANAGAVSSSATAATFALSL